MKRYFVFIFLLWLTSTGRCAYFDYYAGGFRAFCLVQTEDESWEDGPWSDINDSTTSAWVEEYAWVSEESYSYAYDAAWDNNDAENNSVSIRLNSFCDSNEATADSNGTSYGFGSTEDDETYGIFYKLKAGSGEQVGDDVTVYIGFTIKVASWDTTYAYIGGPGWDMEHMAITNGQMPPVVSKPQSQYEVWTLENLELVDESLDGYTSIESFPAKIGDVIGIFAENYTDTSGWGPLSGLIESDVTIVLTAKTVFPGDLDGDGDVDLVDFSKFADNWLAGAD